MTLTVDALHGRIVDLDSHLMLTPDQLSDLLGREKAAQRVANVAANRGLINEFVDGVVEEGGEQLPPSSLASPGGTSAPKDFWTTKGWDAYGAYQPDDRLRALDIIGAERQVVFPTGMWTAVTSPEPAGFDAVRRYNDFVMDWAQVGKGRLRPSAVLNTTDLDTALAEAARIIDNGAYGVELACATPPAGRSPADAAWDPLWAMLEEAGIPAFFHIGGQRGAIDQNFARVPALEASALAGGGETIGPFLLQTMHMAPEIYLTSMILGGVFERHPDLHFGVIELGGRWVGPWCERMDAGIQIFRRRFADLLSLTPSEYVRRQIRVTPFYGEPVGEFIERYGLEDVYVFSTDYPHTEGGPDPIPRFYDSVAPLGDRVVEKFFVDNGKLLLS